MEDSERVGVVFRGVSAAEIPMRGSDTLLPPRIFPCFLSKNLSKNKIIPRATQLLAASMNSSEAH